MQLRIHTLQIRQRNLLPQNHLVETDNEIRVQEPAMEDRQTHTPSNELEVVQMLRVDAGGRVDL